MGKFSHLIGRFWSVIRIVLVFAGWAFFIIGGYYLFNKDWRVVGLFAAIYTILAFLFIQIEWAIINRLNGLREGIDRNREHILEMTRRASDLRLSNIDTYDEFIKIVTRMIKTAENRFLVIRAHHHKGIVKGEKQYFDITFRRVKAGEINMYRRLMTVPMSGIVNLFKIILDKFYDVEGCELKAWIEGKFPINFELIIADQEVVLAFPTQEGGSPQRGIHIDDDVELIERFVALFNQYWNDERARTIKGAEPLTDSQLQSAKQGVQKIYDEIIK